MKQTKIKIYHNPRCSKSRETLEILESRGREFEIIEYLKSPLTISEVEELIALLNLPLSSIVRTKEALFSELNLNLNDQENIVKMIVENPILLERPIVVAENQAVIGRPPENILKLF